MMCAVINGKRVRSENARRDIHHSVSFRRIRWVAVESRGGRGSPFDFAGCETTLNDVTEIDESLSLSLARRASLNRVESLWEPWTCEEGRKQIQSSPIVDARKRCNQTNGRTYRKATIMSARRSRYADSIGWYRLLSSLCFFVRQSHCYRNKDIARRAQPFTHI